MLTGEAEQRPECGHARTAPVEPEDELVEVVGQVFPAHTAVSAPDPRLEVSEDSVDPREQRCRLLRRPLGRGPVIVPALLERGVSLRRHARDDLPAGSTTDAEVRIGREYDRIGKRLAHATSAAGRRTVSVFMGEVSDIPAIDARHSRRRPSQNGVVAF
jgi:hypothetical protein